MKQRMALSIQLLVIFLINIIIISVVQLVPQASPISYQEGSSGSIVSEIQTALYSEDYFSGAVDGVYGSDTTEAVKAFQQSRGMTADGVVGKETLEALGIWGVTEASRSAEVELLARLISAESGDEPYAGQVAVGAVVLNRMNHPSFPNSLSGVIYQPGAFACLADREFDQPIVDSAYKAAEEALAGWDPSGGATYYFNSTNASEWISSRPFILAIGNYRFCS